jgi:hypothetical protein
MTIYVAIQLHIYEPSEVRTEACPKLTANLRPPEISSAKGLTRAIFYAILSTRRFESSQNNEPEKGE